MSEKIYTKTGDKGETSLFGGTKLPKSANRIEAYGTVDELNATIGYLSEIAEHDEIRDVLFSVQNKLFNIGSQLAVDPSKDFDLPSIEESDIEFLEGRIDAMNEQLPELKNFILPSGDRASAYAHISRTVCRRAERRVVFLAGESKVDPQIIKYLNRLSDYLFVLARHILQKNERTEVKWNPEV